jgi:glycosyltransferase involved in cell wall biosynthesis
VQILALSERANHVCCRYRIAAYRSAIETAGGRLRIEPLARDVTARIGQLRAARGADVIVLQRRLLPRWQLWLLRRWARALVYDFDDAIFRRSSFSQRGPTSWQRQRAFRATVAAADLTIAGNPYLREKAAEIVGHERVQLIPTCVDVRNYARAEHRRTASDVKLVWIGQRSTLKYLVDAKPCLAAAAQRLPGLDLRVVSDVFPADCGIACAPRVWAAETEAADLADADIGISWLTDDDWSRGKCGLKVLQYMAAGLPVVANRVGANCDMVVDGQTGYLASTPEEWATAVELLARDPARRRRMGENGRRLARERYSVDRWAPEFVATMARLCRYEVTLIRIAGSSDATWQPAHRKEPAA